MYIYIYTIFGTNNILVTNHGEGNIYLFFVSNDDNVLSSGDYSSKETIATSILKAAFVYTKIKMALWGAWKNQIHASAIKTSHITHHAFRFLKPGFFRYNRGTLQCGLLVHSYSMWTQLG